MTWWMAKKDGKEKGTYNYNDNSYIFVLKSEKNYTKITGMVTNIIIRAMRSLLLQLQVPTNASHIQETDRDDEEPKTCRSLYPEFQSGPFHNLLSERGPLIIIFQSTLAGTLFLVSKLAAKTLWDEKDGKVQCQ